MKRTIHVASSNSQTDDADANRPNLETDTKRPRRMEVADIDGASLDDCKRAYQKTDEIINASDHIKSCSLDGGVDVKIGKIIPFPGYDDDAQEDLIDNLLRAIDWRYTAGFVPYFFHKKSATPIVKSEPDSMQIDEDYPQRSNSSPTSEASDVDPIRELNVEDLAFHVPSLGHGTYRTFKDRETRLRKVEYILGREDREDDDISWFVYTQEEPVIEARGDEERPFVATPVAYVNSPVARLLPRIEDMRLFYKADRKANDIATSPPYFVQHLPPQKDSTQLTTSQLHADGRGNAQQTFGRTRPPKVDYSPNPDGSVTAVDEKGNKNVISRDVARIMTREIPVEYGRTYAGLFTPHAYTRISERELDFVTKVSIAFGVPVHVVIAGKSSASSSSGMTGARAGGKEPQATGSKGSVPAVEKQKASNGGFNSDPSFTKALQMRDFLQSFFRSVMYSKHGNSLHLAAYKGLEKFQREAELTTKLVEELDVRIKAAQEAVLNFGNVIEQTSQQQEQLRQNDMTNKLNVTDPDTVKKVNDEAMKPTPPKPANGSGGGGGGGGKKPSAGDLSAPDAGLEAPKNGVPSPSEVETLNKRRLELINSLQSISEAMKLREQIASVRCPVSLVYRQPIINDTSQIQPVIESLGLTQERGYAIAQRRYGLLS